MGYFRGSWPASLRDYPRVVLSVYAANNMHLEFPLLRHRKVDFLIGGLTKPVADEDLDIEVLYHDRPFIVSGVKSRWAGRRNVALAELVDEPWLLPHESIFSSVVEEAFQSQGLIRPKLGVRTYSTYQRLSLLATDDFVGGESGSVLRFNIDRFPLKILPVDFPVRSWPVVIATLKDRTVQFSGAVLHRMRSRGGHCDDAEGCRQSRPQKSERDDKWSFCLTADTLGPANQERP